MAHQLDQTLAAWVQPAVDLIQQFVRPSTSTADGEDIEVLDFSSSDSRLLLKP